MVSLNEMGAAWILRSMHRSFLTSDCDFSMLTGVVNSNEIAFKAGSDETEHLLHDFRYDIKEFFSLDMIPDAVWESVKREFVEKVKSFRYQREKSDIGKKQISVVKQAFTDNENLVIGYLKQEGKEMRMSDISANIGLPIHTTLRIIRKLIDEKIIVPIGAEKYGKYRLA